MSKSTYAIAVIATLAIAGCTGGATGPSARSTRVVPSSTSSARATPACLAGADARPLRVRNGPTAALLGSGSRGVILSNESDEDLCSWAGFARALAAAGNLVALYDYSGEAVSDLSAVAGALRAQGAGSLVLVGASEGAKASIVAAARLHPNAVASLSAEAVLEGESVAPYARRLNAPVVFATAANDPYGATSATRVFYRAAPADRKRLVVVPGSAHGTALLANSSVRKAVVDLVARVPAGSTSFDCGAGATKLTLTAAGGYRLRGLALGAGPTAAVFLHELGPAADLCGFWPYASWLTEHYDVRAVLVNRCGVGRSRCPSELPSGDDLVRPEVGPAVAWARAHGASRVVLVGASAGGGDALEAAASVSGVDAVVDLSGDITSTHFPVLAAAKRVRVPTLMAVAPNDTACPLPGFKRQYEALPAATKRLVVVPDPMGRHGWDLVGAIGVDLQQLAPRVADWIEGQYG